MLASRKDVLDEAMKVCILLILKHSLSNGLYDRMKICISPIPRYDVCLEEALVQSLEFQARLAFFFFFSWNIIFTLKNNQ